jgi:hypothetical protein
MQTSFTWTKLLGGTALQSLSRLGVNAVADATNPISANIPQALFNNAGAGINIVLNKNAAGNDASFQFKTGFSTRALLGLHGDNNLSVKVSPNGSTYYTPLTFSSSNGWAYFAGVTGLTPSFSAPVTFQNNDNNYNCIIAGSGGNFRWALGTDAAANATLFTFNNVDLRLGVGPSPTAIVAKVGNTVGINTSTTNDTLTVNGNTVPLVDNTNTIGKSGFRWSAVWAANGVIQTSDERDKDVKDTINGKTALRLVSSIHPKFFTWKIGGYELTTEAKNEASVMINELDVKLCLEDVKLRKKLKISDNVGVSQTKPLFKTPKKGNRLHAGFIAQDVKTALDALDLDFGVWGKENTSDDSSKQFLRPDQLIPVLWSALNELLERVENLERQITTKT